MTEIKISIERAVNRLLFIKEHELQPADKLSSAAIKMAIQALEKQLPQKIICETVDEKGVEYEFEHYLCPDCKNILHQRYKKSREPMRYKQNYCTDCGQKLNWD